MWDKRRKTRQATLERCVVNRLFLEERPLPMRVINHTNGGLMLELDTLLHPGEAISIQLPDVTREIIGLPVESCVGLVRWCVRQDGSYGGLYGAGVELAAHMLRRFHA